MNMPFISYCCSNAPLKWLPQQFYKFLHISKSNLQGLYLTMARQSVLV